MTSTMNSFKSVYMANGFRALARRPARTALAVRRKSRPLLNDKTIFGEIMTATPSPSCCAGSRWNCAPSKRLSFACPISEAGATIGGGKAQAELQLLRQHFGLRWQAKRDTALGRG